MAGLINALVEGVQGGAIPRPVPNEPIDEFRFRCAHAGAVLAISWMGQPRDVPGTSPGEDVPGTSPVTEFEESVLAEFARAGNA